MPISQMLGQGTDNVTQPTNPVGDMSTRQDWGSLLPQGIGNSQQATQATSAMRQSPWYNSWLKQQGLTPQGNAYGNVTLNDQQQQNLLDAARKNGIGISDSYQIDQNGQIAQTPSHLWRNIGIGAGIGALGLTGLGAFGIGPLAGMLGGTAGVADLGAVNGAMIGGAEAAPTVGSMMAEAGLAGGLGTGAAAGAAGAGLSDMAGTGFGSWTMGAPTEAQLAADAATPGLASTQSGAGSTVSNIVSKLLSGDKSSQNPLSTISSLLGAASSGAKANRVTGANIGSQFANASVNAQNSANATRDNALRDLSIANYLQNQKTGYTPGTISLGGQQRQLPDFGFGFKAPSAAQVQSAGDLTNTAQGLLKPGGTFMPNPGDFQAQPGGGENALSTGGSIAGMVGPGLSIARMLGVL